MKRRLFILTVFFILTETCLYAQLSEGGIPRKMAAYKNASIQEVRMPDVSNDLLRWQNTQEGSSDGMLKPLTFAHTFPVRLSPLTHGAWSRSGDGWWVWQLTVFSQGAFSLNLLFEDIHLPQGARLFIFTPDQSQQIGAFTSATISNSSLFTTMPLEGEKVIVQYELPVSPGNNPDFIISGVNHDFIGILKYTDTRRPMGVTAGACNLDISCSAGAKWEESANSVCRVMVLGRDLCTGTLLNNTAQNKKPYILTANHCISTPLKATGSLFLFNYESPYCGSIDGDVTNSLSGSKLKATLDSLDFALVELNTPPPPALRPYYAGWNRNTSPADTMASVHHPQGDIKKIAIDYDRPVTSTFLSTFVKNAFWKVMRWEVGTTEIGSSGGPLFNKSGQLAGTLSGGAAECGDPVNDYFSRFDLAWNYKPDSARQLKYWLDPAGSNPLSLNGKQFNSGEQFCTTFTNLVEGDVPKILKSANPSGGYWSGTNQDGISEVADRFTLPGNERLQGVSLGIGKKYQLNSSNNSFLTLRVYNLKGNTPEILAVRDSVMLKNLVADAMNYIKFNTPVEAADSFLIAVGFNNVRPGDSLVLFQAVRPARSANSFWLKKNNAWVRFPEISPGSSAGALVMEVLACNVGGTQSDSVLYEQKYSVLIWPNPAVSVFNVQTSADVDADKVGVYNIHGQLIRCEISRKYDRHLEINMKDNPPGIYFIRVENKGKFQTGKVLLMTH